MELRIPGRVAMGVLLGCALAACTLTGSPGTIAGAPDTSVPGTDTSTTDPVANSTVVVPLRPFAGMGPGWTEIVIPYGDTEDMLGLPGALDVGPTGTQTPDGRWWILDVPGRRFARFAEAGTYLDSVPIPDETSLARAFAFREPMGLDDGTVLAYSVRGPTTALLVATDGVVSEEEVAGGAPWDTTDGSLLYGRAGDAAPFRLDPVTLTVDATDWFQARDGSRYLITVMAGDVTVTLPDAAVVSTLQIRLAEQPEIEVRFNLQVETGSDGSLFLLVHGRPLSDDTLQVGGLITLSPDGRVTRIQPITDPTTASGGTAQLGVTPGTSHPWLMVIEPEGVRIHLRVN